MSMKNNSPEIQPWQEDKNKWDTKLGAAVLGMENEAQKGINQSFWASTLWGEGIMCLFKNIKMQNAKKMTELVMSFGETK
jgi:hypothetical protein